MQVQFLFLSYSEDFNLLRVSKLKVLEILTTEKHQRSFRHFLCIPRFLAKFSVFTSNSSKFLWSEWEIVYRIKTRKTTLIENELTVTFVGYCNRTGLNALDKVQKYFTSLVETYLPINVWNFFFHYGFPILLLARKNLERWSTWLKQENSSLKKSKVVTKLYLSKSINNLRQNWFSRALKLRDRNEWSADMSSWQFGRFQRGLVSQWSILFWAGNRTRMWRANKSSIGPIWARTQSWMRRELRLEICSWISRSQRQAQKRTASKIGHVCEDECKARIPN